MAAMACAFAPPSAEAEEIGPAPRLRRPIALAVSDDGGWLYVANRRSGSLSVIDLAERRAIAELDLGETFASLARVDRTRFLAVDEGRHELLLLRTEGKKVEVVSRLAVSPFPVEAVVTQDGRRAFVASLWSRRLTEVALSSPEASQMSVTRVSDLAFAPRKMLLLREDSRLIVADAFAGRLGVFDAAKGKLLAIREFPAHNIRGLSVTPDGKMLAVAHQMLNELAQSNRNDVHWGLLMSNDLRWLPVDAVLDPQAELYAGAHMHPLGEAGRGGGDPSGMAMTADGLAITTLGGAHQVAVGRERDFTLRRLAVGRRPTAVALSPDSSRAYVANTFDDSISVIGLEREEGLGEISLGPQADLSLADRGEMLFYDARLAHDRWMSCHSCHTDGHANGSMNDNLSDASYGAPKRVLTLLGVSDTAPYAWNGQVADLETQIRNSINKTMAREEPASDEEVQGLAAYLHSLTPPPAVEKLRAAADRTEIDRAAIERGRQIFSARKCDRCHAPPTYTTPDVYDVGLVDAQGTRHFNPPSLLGVGQRGPYFHDNRAATLQAVFTEHGHPAGDELNDRELADLLAFLRSL